jgi:hypothetical protein
MSTEPDAVLPFPARTRALALIGGGKDGDPSRPQSLATTADNWPPADPGVPDWPPPDLDDCGESIIPQPSNAL